MHLQAPVVAKDILAAKNAKECKKQSYFIDSTNKWDGAKRGVMKMIVHENFSQNTEIKAMLLATGTTTLIEATTDLYWGAGSVFGSKLLKEGKWSGRNELGIILNEVREDLRRTESWKTSANPHLSGETSSRGMTENRPESHYTQSGNRSISFVPPEKACEVRNALDDYSNRKAKKGGGHRKGGNKKLNQSQGPRLNNPGKYQTPHAQNLPARHTLAGSHSVPNPRTQQSVPLPSMSRMDMNADTSYTQVGQSGTSTIDTQLPITLPSMQVPPPGIPYPIPSFPYFNPALGFFPGYMNQMNAMPTNMPYGPSQPGCPPVMTNPNQNQIPVQMSMGSYGMNTQAAPHNPLQPNFTSQLPPGMATAGG